MEEEIAVLIPFGVFAMIVLNTYFSESRQRAERMALIKRGVNPIKYDIKLPGRLGLPWGVIFSAVGFGFFIPTIITGNWSEPAEIGWSLACIIAGIGLIVYWKMTASDRERALRIKEEMINRTGLDFEPNGKIEDQE